MRVSIHQPEHLPWMGFFSKMNASDLMVILEDAQFEKNYFQNRNRIADPTGRCHWLTVSCELIDGHKTAINRVQLKPTDQWIANYFGKLRHSLSHCEYFDPVSEWLATEFESHRMLSTLNISLISRVAHSLGISTNTITSSHFKVSTRRSERLIEILKACSASEYLIGKGSLNYLDLDLFRKNRIKVYLVEVDPIRNLSVSGEPLSCLQELAERGFEGLREPLFDLREVPS